MLMSDHDRSRTPDRTLDMRRPRVSVIIKALNEERNIAAAIKSAIAALAGIDGEVILADCLSTDQTVAVARRYPITTVSLKSIDARSCGAGAQLGFQYSQGEFICLMDGDMRLCEDFLPAAIRYLEANPGTAGVGGSVVECEATNLEFVKRRQNQDSNREAGVVNRLDCSGVYRRSAIQSLGYLMDRNIHGGEELDLGARLIARGWTLVRLDRPAVEHDGHAGSAYRLLLRRLATRVAFGSGEVLRAAVGQPHFSIVISANRTFALWFAVQFWWLIMLILPFLLTGPIRTTLAGTALLLLPIVCMSFRLGSFRMGLYSIAAWNVYALGFWPGFLRRRIPPADWIDSIVLRKSPASASIARDVAREAV
jgi:glycosyltransferase involved in cell wall biosynthesis